MYYSEMLKGIMVSSPCCHCRMIYQSTDGVIIIIFFNMYVLHYLVPSSNMSVYHFVPGNTCLCFSWLYSNCCCSNSNRKRLTLSDFGVSLKEKIIFGRLFFLLFSAGCLFRLNDTIFFYSGIHSVRHLISFAPVSDASEAWKRCWWKIG